MKENKLEKLHVNNGYYCEIRPIPKMDGVIAKFPKNIIENLSEREIIYEITNDGIIIYSNNQKFDSLKCDIYAKRVYILLHILKEIDNRKLSFNLIRILKKNKLVRLKTPLYSFIEYKLDDENLKLEKELYHEVMKFFDSDTNDKFCSRESVSSGYNFIISELLDNFFLEKK